MEKLEDPVLYAGEHANVRKLSSKSHISPKSYIFYQLLILSLNIFLVVYINTEFPRMEDQAGCTTREL